MIVKLSDLTTDQKKQFIILFGKNFFHLIDKKGKHTKKLEAIFADAFLQDFLYAYLNGDSVAGLIACSNKNSCAVRFNKSVCKAEFGSILGTVNYRFIKRFFGKPIAKAADEGYIDYLCVHKDHRRSGIASLLMDFVYTNTPYKTYSLEVVGKNAGAIKLYERRGYKVAEVKKSMLLRIVLKDFVYLMKYTKAS